MAAHDTRRHCTHLFFAHAWPVSELDLCNFIDMLEAHVSCHFTPRIGASTGDAGGPLEEERGSGRLYAKLERSVRTDFHHYWRGQTGLQMCRLRIKFLSR